MYEHDLLHRILKIAVRETRPGTARADAIVSWCHNHGKFLGLPKLSGEDEKAKKKKNRKKHNKRKDTERSLPWKRLCAALDELEKGEEAKPLAAVAVADRLATLLSLEERDGRLLGTVICMRWVSRIASLVYRLRSNGMDEKMLAAELTGFDTADAVSQSAIVRLGLVTIEANRDGVTSFYMSDAVQRALEHDPSCEQGLIETLIGPRAETCLGLADFEGLGEPVNLVSRILKGAVESRAEGVNILLYGPPGTGKTELAKALAASVKSDLHAVGEVDDYGDEPNRWDRVTALKVAQRILANRKDAVLLFDEMEDLIGDARPMNGGAFFTSRNGSKVFVNRMFEGNPVPTIWTTNTIENIDPAYLRRMSYVLKMDVPSDRARQRIVKRIADTEGGNLSDKSIDRLCSMAPEVVTVARTAIRTANLAKGGEREIGAVADALVSGVRHGRRSTRYYATDGSLDLELYQSSTAIGDLVKQLARPDAPLDFSLLLTGPPGTGKTALAHHVAKALDRPLVIKRVSDVVSKWVGETEKNIADAFAEAADNGEVLLFDEIDSLLFDRATANRSWEVSQVNELLTWMDHHPMPFIAATNHGAKLDPAAMRRFVFKLELEALPARKAAHAYRWFFGRKPPKSLSEIEGLTPGDFAVVGPPIAVCRRRCEAS